MEENNNISQSLIYFGKAFYFLYKAIQSLLHRLVGAVGKVISKYPLVSLGCVIIVFMVIYVIGIGKYRIARDLYSKRLQQDKQRIYRLQNDSIALRDLSNEGVKHDTIIIIKKVKVIQKKDSL